MGKQSESNDVSVIEAKEEVKKTEREKAHDHLWES